MLRRIFATTVIAALGSQVRAQACLQIDGNYYCSQTNAIAFNNVGFAGTYNQITNMDSTSCSCASQPFSFSGGLAPLNKEVSLHFRGPIHIGQIAVYHGGAGAKEKREADPFPALSRHKHKRGHHNDRRQGATWTRSSYYNAATGEADNIVFLNHLGGTNGSGAWDSCFGNSLSYSSCDGVHGAASPQVLGNVVIPSDQEVVVFSGAQCGSDCGYVRPGTPAYEGFSTSTDTVFLLQFMMPRDSGSGFNVDMSAAWFLNAQIPRTLQYGNGACSCWISGCGELDVFEILSTGSNYLTATLHTWQGTGTQYGGGGCSDYIERPLSSYMTAAVIFSVETQKVNIVVVDPSTAFGATLTSAQVQGWVATAGSQVNIASGG